MLNFRHNKFFIFLVNYHLLLHFILKIVRLRYLVMLKESKSINKNKDKIKMIIIIRRTKIIKKAKIASNMLDL
jgi:hypothetical protein